MHVQPIGAVTVGQKGERLAELGAMASTRARVRVFSDDGFCVFDPLIMRRALEYVKAFDGVVAQHAQDPRLTEGAQMNEGAVSAELGLAGWPAVAEESIIARDVLLAEHVGSRLHVCHLSTAGSVDIIRWAKKRGVNVTAEVTPHHLLLSEELVRGYDARFKVNPPLRRDEDVQAVREGLADGTIDIVATDHAPHPDESKSCEWQAAANGMVGLESALRVVHQAMVETGMLTWDDVARVMSAAPARIGRLSGAGTPLEAGAPASLTLYDPAPVRTFARGDLHGRSVNSPYLGRDFRRGALDALPGRGDRRRRRRGARDDGGGARMSREGALLVMIAVAIALLAIGVIAWRRRTRRDAGLAAPFGEAPAAAVERERVSGLYVATTRHSEPLERLAIRGLGFRSRVDVTITDRGVALDLTGQPRLFLETARIADVDLATVAIDRVVERGGLVRLTWRAGDTLVDSYLRPQDGSARALAAAIAAILPAPTATTPTGTDA